MLVELKKIKRTELNDMIIISEISKKQRQIFKHFDMDIYSIQYEMRSIREHLKKIGDNSEQTRILIHVFFLLFSLKF